MHLTMQFDTEGIDFELIAALFAKAEFPGRDAETLKKDFEEADVVCFAYDIARLLGAGRVKDGVVRDLCVLPSYVGYGPGLVMYEYLAKRAGLENPPIEAAGEVERAFIEKAELDEHLA